MRIRRLGLVALLAGSLTPAPGDGEIDLLVPLGGSSVEGEMAEREFDLRDPGDMPALRLALVRLNELAEAQEKYEDAHPERFRPFEHDVSSKGKRRALGESLELLDQMAAAGGAADTGRSLHLLELLHAVQNSFRYPVPPTLQLIPDVIPLLLLQLRRHQTVEAATAAAPVPDPPRGSFWRDPGDIASADLYTGFRRLALPRHEDELCEYKGPKTGWGAHPGFDVECAGKSLGFKLGDERFGGPFNSRLFDALGYHTEPLDPMRRLRLRYDRRVLAEYNVRKLLAVEIKLLFIPVKTHIITKFEDPFARIDSAVLRDGSRLTGAELKRRLLRDSAVVADQPRPETVPANYDPAVEREIDYLVWQAGTISHDSDDIQSIGAWDYDQLDHAARREVRALFVLAAWVDQFNLRWENTRLTYLKEGEDWTLVHMLSDVGSGLGLARDMRRSYNSAVDSMLWEVTERRTDGSVRFSGFASSMENTAFSNVSADDARWILRRMARLSESQILAGLLATDMSAAEARLALEKLVSRRQRMIEDFGLAGEFPALVSRQVDRELDFDPANPADLASVSLETPGGRVIPASGNWKIRQGRLLPLR